jgi:CHAT domain-containing protein
MSATSSIGHAEPSLALTLPKQPTELDDGMLAASEVAHLKLNADWVVLSACHTAAPRSPAILLGPPWCAIRTRKKQIQVSVRVP